MPTCEWDRRTPSAPFACINEHGALYVLSDSKDGYTLSDQRTPEKSAAQNVTVRGTLDIKTKTIRVDSITAAK
jgi:hypothetical protein